MSGDVPEVTTSNQWRKHPPQCDSLDQALEQEGYEGELLQNNRDRPFNEPRKLCQPFHLLGSLVC